MYELLFLGLLLVQQLVAEINFESRFKFATDLYNEIASTRTEENVVFSPASIQTCLALLYLGTGMHTEVELRKGLHLESYANKTDVAADYKEFLNLVFNNPEIKFMMANRIYIDDTYAIKPEYNALASDFFGSEVENVKFEDADKTAEIINSWVESKTEQKIKNLVDPSAFTVDTAIAIVNALYFKAEWRHKFYTGDRDNFYNKENDIASVQMMSRKKTYVKYGRIPSLDAAAIELPYKSTNLSMLVLLPNKIDGLPELERKINSTNLKELTQEHLGIQEVNIYIPKFKLDFGLGLIETLKTLGMRSMFNDAADLTGILQTARTLTVSEVKHKAFIEVNELGTEAAASTYVQAESRMLSLHEPAVFKANHPFLFAIKDENAIYFMGHVVKL